MGPSLSLSPFDSLCIWCYLQEVWPNYSKEKPCADAYRIWRSSKGPDLSREAIFRPIPVELSKESSPSHPMTIKWGPKWDEQKKYPAELSQLTELWDIIINCCFKPFCMERFLGSSCWLRDITHPMLICGLHVDIDGPMLIEVPPLCICTTGNMSPPLLQW